ncbi:MAG TPA: hypothetical protein VL981_04830 [Candidatus Methylacidiphilales bacterium]|nr:hypothetical protein [Candidatus Methylacidiphilales bacterium]
MPATDPSLGLRKRFILLAPVILMPLLASAQDFAQPGVNPPPGTNDSTPATNQPPAAPATQPTPPANPSAVEQLTQSNRELLDLLKKQQGVLEDIQYDRRLQSRQIEQLEVRLTETLQDNAALQAKVAKLQAELDALPASPPAAPASTPPPTAPPAPAPPPAPATYLPPAPEITPGLQSWHRIYTLSGADNQTSDSLHIQGSTWRVLWHNQDKAGDAYKNTSALFINAFAKGDTIPQKVCAKLGSGGDAASLTGPGDFKLKIEASGGKWELAVEDFY